MNPVERAVGGPAELHRARCLAALGGPREVAKRRGPPRQKEREVNLFVQLRAPIARKYYG